jgi:hypothetical protein
MRKLFHPFWTWFTIILTLIFVVLLPASIISRLGLFKTAIFTLIGVAVIWIVYFIRAFIFSKFLSEENKTKENHSP